MKIHLLDMGQTKYGDCLLVENNGRKILVDGAHPGDTNSIRSQLRKIFNTPPPFQVDLLIVTHCHSDHIGCLPDLVGLGQLNVSKALVADENLGFGRTSAGDAASDKVKSGLVRELIPALQEEDFSDLGDEELEQFIDDAATLETKYIQMLAKLEEQGAKVYRYGRDFSVGDPATSDALKDFELEFADFGLKILGPSLMHLFTCAEILSNASDVFPSDADAAKLVINEAASLTQMYRAITKRIDQDLVEGVDRPGPGAAKNNQSIVLSLAAGGLSALLPGDMQLAKAEVSGLRDHMRDLLRQIAAHGPYDFVKLSHHTSYNGFDKKVFEALAGTKLFAHTGGRQDASHPEESALELLRENSSKLSFARTDRNGIITVFVEDGIPKMSISRGAPDDFKVNKVADEPATTNEPVSSVFFTPESAVIPQQNYEERFVEFNAKIPHVNTKVTITINVEKPEANSIALVGAGKPPDQFRGRVLENILYVTCSDRLSLNVGRTETTQILNFISQHLKGQIVDIPAIKVSAPEISKTVGERLRSGSFKGVVVIGGYDVIPAQRLDVLDNKLRQELRGSGQIGLDADNFFVWSDDIYGDLDGDLLPELPVSRIPDGKDYLLLMAALTAQEFAVRECFAIRNVARPFGDRVFNIIPGSSGAPHVSEVFKSKDVLLGSARGAVYYMLHGSDEDGARFYGETQDGDAIEAFSVENVPSSAAGTVVFTGCCWGALTIYERADQSVSLPRPTTKAVKDSIALSYLKAGAVAYVGCTGSHYSPLSEPYDYYGRPMHEHFWKAIQAGTKPSQALFNAKLAYLQKMPHRRKDAYSRAIEMKILRQYTCLGLGW